METSKKMVIASIILSTVNEAGETPEGVLYAGLMGKVSLDVFNGIIHGLVETGLLSRPAAFCLAITDKGRLVAKAFDDAMSRAQTV